MIKKSSFQKFVIFILIITIISITNLRYCSAVTLSYSFEKLSSISTNGETVNVIIVGDIAFALDSTDSNPGGLVIIDISDLNNPSKISSYYDGGTPFELVFKDDCVIIADGADGLEIINVTDLENPVEIYQYSVNNYCTDIELVGDLLYVANWDLGLEVFNVSDLENPYKINSYNSNNLNCLQITTDGNLAVVTDHRNDYTSLVLLNITNPVSPQYIIQYVKSDTDFWDPILHNNYLFVGNHAINGGEMQILNITVPTDISLVSKYDQGGSIFSITFNNSIAFLSNRNKGVEVVDVSDLLNPIRVGRYDDGGQAKKITIKNDLIFVADREDGLEILIAEVSTKTATGLNFLITTISLSFTSTILITISGKKNDRKNK